MGIGWAARAIGARRWPSFASPRALALSYADPYVDYTGRVTGFAVVDVNREMGS
jgi:hypothetical protein